MSAAARAGALATALLVLTGCVGAGPPAATSTAGGTSSGATGAMGASTVLSDEVLAPLLDALVTRTPTDLDVRRLAEGLIPPTNRWYSGLVFGESPQPVFPMPLSFALTGDGFALGLPPVTATADTISAGHVPAVPVGVGAASAVVVSDDPSVVVVEHRDAAGTALGSTTIAQGSPFVTYEATAATRLDIPDGFTPTASGATPGTILVATLAGTRYALLTDGSVDGSTLTLGADGRAVWWAIPDGTEPAALAPAAAATVRASSVGYTVGDTSVTTTLSYAADGTTAVARLPHQASDEACTLGTYPSLYGTLTVCAGSSLTWETPRTQARASLDLSGLSADERQTLVGYLEADVAALPAFPADTYFGGKALQRTAMLLMVADELGQDALAATLASALDAALARWTDPTGCTEREASCFVHDPLGHGIIGLAASFGSDEYNDHHFHYGYFLYAAAILARHDPASVQRHAPVMTLLAADIASAGNSVFPDRRTFDVYAGHSWASGTSPFADGNNQESVSEAVNAWAGLSLWADAVGDRALGDEAAWMLSLEAQSSLDAWLAPDLSAFAGYEHAITVLNWGGKRDYATWFSPDPGAKLGILLLPMSPTSLYLAGDSGRISAQVATALSGASDQPLADYIALYAALAGNQGRATALEVLGSRSAWDDGMSRTYAWAWVWSLPA